MTPTESTHILFHWQATIPICSILISINIIIWTFLFIFHRGPSFQSTVRLSSSGRTHWWIFLQASGIWEKWRIFFCEYLLIWIKVLILHAKSVLPCWQIWVGFSRWSTARQSQRAQWALLDHRFRLHRRFQVPKPLLESINTAISLQSLLRPSAITWCNTTL